MELTSIRCPLKVQDKYGNTFVCDRSNVKVYAGSKGEIRCPSCKRIFSFEVGSQYNEPKRTAIHERIEVQHENN